MKLRRKIYLLAEYILIRAITTIFRFQKVKGGVAIIRLDAIGDYILFRNFLYELKQSPKFADLPVTIIGNQAWKSIAETFDIMLVDNFIWLDRNQIWDNKKYRISKLLSLVKTHYEYIIVPTFSRDFASDGLVKLMNGKHKITSLGDLSNISNNEKIITDMYYTEILPANSEILFEFERNREFFQNLLGYKLNTKPLIKAVATMLHNQFTNYVVLFVGAGSNKRRWGTSNFNSLAIWLNEVYDVNVVICGSINDISADSTVVNMPFIHNLIGKTNLVEMVDILSKAKFVVSNETSIPHICIAVDVKVFVISNGNHFVRFTPYPDNLTNKYYSIYHSEIEKNLGDYKYLSNEYGYGSNLDINNITIEQVKNKIMRNIDVTK
jgi:ADP-heptose:LPS heptosyltransferase